MPELETGVHLLYELKPEEARNQFEAWQRSHPEVARTQLKELVAEFPENPLFSSELAKIRVSPAATIPPEG